MRSRAEEKRLCLCDRLNLVRRARAGQVRLWTARRTAIVGELLSLRWKSADSPRFSPFNSRLEESSRSSRGSVNTALTQTSPARRPSVTVSTDDSRVSTPTTARAPLSDLELRLDVERTLDLFTMTHKVCWLNIAFSLTA